MSDDAIWRGLQRSVGTDPVVYDDPVEKVVQLRLNGTWRFIRRNPDTKVTSILIEGELPDTDGSGTDVYGRPIEKTIPEILEALGPPGQGREWGNWCSCGGYTKMATAPSPHCTHCGAPFLKHPLLPAWEKETKC